MTIQRWDLDAGDGFAPNERESGTGEWVRWLDVEHLAEDLERAKRSATISDEGHEVAEARALAAEARVAELEAYEQACKVLGFDLSIPQKCAVGLKARVAELEAAAKPRPMSEAPWDTWVLLEVGYENPRQAFEVRKGVKGRDYPRAWIDETGRPGCPDSTWSGWYPLPDERKEDE